MKEIPTHIVQPQGEAKENANRTGRIIIITGPTGVGKDLVMQELLRDEKLNAKRIVLPMLLAHHVPTK